MHEIQNTSNQILKFLLSIMSNTMLEITEVTQNVIKCLTSHFQNASYKVKFQQVFHFHMT